MSELYFPYYIDQARLLDIYAILNGGCSEYEEICHSATDDVKKGAKGSLNWNGGFKLFKIGGSVEGSFDKASSEQSSLTARRVQTTTSIMSLVLNELKEKGYIHTVRDSVPGSFILEPVRLRINSIKSLVDEAKDLVLLSEKMTNLDKPQKGKGDPNAKSTDVKNMEAISSVVRELFGAEEIVHLAEDYALVGNVLDRNLYQAVRSDIIGTELRCLAQVMRVFPDGAQLLRNTTFSKLRDAEAKGPMIKSLIDIARDSNFDYEASEPIVEITDRPVYQVQPIALFQSSRPVGDDQQLL